MIEIPTPSALNPRFLFQSYNMPAKLFDLAGTLTPSHDLGKPLHVGKFRPDSAKASVPTALPVVRFGNPTEFADIAPLEFELWN